MILFDGMCNFCNGAVNFLIDRDPSGRLAFAALQSEVGRALLAEHGLDPPGVGAADTLVLIEGERASIRSTAALRITAYLRAPWPLLRLLLVVPRPVRDAGYRVFARNRYRWFGRRETCRAPTPDIRARFVG